MRRLLVVALTLAALGCGGSPEREGQPPSGGGGPGRDAGPNADAGSTSSPDAGPRDLGLEAPGDGFAIAVTAAAFVPGSRLEEPELAIGLAIRNGARAPSLSFGAPITLETSGGLGIVGQPASARRGGCPREASLLPGAERICVFEFSLPRGESPRVVRLASSESSASAPVEACGAASPTGWCEPPDVCGEGCVYAQCVGGDCRAPCSSSAPSGFCAGPDETCRNGRCRAPCSAAQPDGWCGEGQVCVNGACEMNMCPPLVTPLTGQCFTCIESVCPELGCLGQGCEECVSCAFQEADWCGCLDLEICRSCRTEVQSLFTRITRDCAVCF